MLQELKVNMRNVKFYMMDEWADEDGNIAPLSYRAGFGHAFQEFMIKNIQGLGFREENFIYHSNETTPVFTKMLEEDGEADIIYSGPGWPGHLAFIDPVDDWFKPTMEEYLEQGAKVARLHPLTIAQNSLHGAFGYSGDISKVPPKGAMMGPRDAMKAKNVLDMHETDVEAVHLRQAGPACAGIHTSAPGQAHAYDNERESGFHHRTGRLFPVLRDLKTKPGAKYSGFFKV